jgi:hypothetical protein
VPAGNYLINELTTLNEVVTKLPRLTYEAYWNHTKISGEAYQWMHFPANRFI